MDPTIVAPDKVEARIFGALATPQLWAQDLRSRYALALMNLERQSLIRVDARRRFVQRNHALSVARQALVAGDFGRNRQIDDAERLLAALDSVSICREIMDGRPVPDSDQRLVEEAIWMSLDLGATRVEELMAAIEGEFDEDCAQLSDVEEQGVGLARESLAVAFRTDGPTRSDQMAMAFATLQERLRLNQAVNSPGVWFRMGWLLWMLGDDRVVAQRAVHEATRLSGRERSTTSWMANRLHAQMFVDDGDFESAHRAILPALQIRQDAATAVEAALIAAHLQKRRETRTLLHHAILEQPLCLLDALCMEGAPEWPVEVLAAMAEVQTKLIETGKGLLSQWEATAKRVKDASDALGRGDLVHAGLLDDHRDLSKRLPKADLLVAWFVNRSSESSRRVLLDQARQTLDREYRRCEDLLRDTEGRIEAIESSRNTQCSHLQRGRDAAVARAREEVRRAMKYETALDQGCGVSVGVAFVGFGVFAVIAAVGVVRGFSFGIDTIPGKVALAFATLPMAFFLFAQIGQSVARARLQFAINSKIELIDAEFRKTIGEVDRQYREALTVAREELDDRNRELRSLREGQRMIAGARTGAGGAAAA